MCGAVVYRCTCVLVDDRGEDVGKAKLIVKRLALCVLGALRLGFGFGLLWRGVVAAGGRCFGFAPFCIGLGDLIQCQIIVQLLVLDSLLPGHDDQICKGRLHLSSRHSVQNVARVRAAALAKEAMETMVFCVPPCRSF